MKKAGLSLIYLVFIFGLIPPLNAQKKTHVIIRGTELVIPFSPFVKDSSSVLSLCKEELTKIEKLICANNDYTIKSFNFVTVMNGDVLEFKVPENSFTPEVKKIVATLNSGAKIWLENIYAKGQSDQEVKLREVNLKIE